MKKGVVYIIGAGCGSRDLITVRGLERLQCCDAVVYDDLIDDALLDEAPRGSLQIYMGKRSGRHSAPQNEISEKLTELALSGKNVARLKGGDPFVFGRGGEEIQALQRAGIPFELIPGISSSIAIPAAAGIPVTHRGLSRSFHVITAHTADGSELPDNISELAKLEGTLIFLMGLSRLEKLSDALIERGKPADTPAAVISGGNSPNPAAVRGRLDNIAALCRRADVKPPAVIVVGETAAMELNKGALKRPLEGVRAGITGTDSIQEKLRALLAKEGASPVTVQRSEIKELPAAYDAEKLADGKVHWLVFTSANGVRIFLKQLRQLRFDLRRLYRCKFAVIGRPTGRLLEEQGIYPELCPEVFTSAALAELLCEKAAGDEDVILLRAENGAEILPRKLRAAGIEVQDTALYSLGADKSVTERGREKLRSLDYLIFSSAGGVKLFIEEYGTMPENAVCVSIGAVTAEALRECGKREFIVADTADAEGIVRAIVKDHLK